MKTNNTDETKEGRLMEDGPFMNALMELPEVATLIHKLKSELNTLDDILSTSRQDGDKINFEITGEQMDVIKCISPGVKSLVRCLNEHTSAKKKDKNSKLPEDLVLKMKDEQGSATRSSAEFIAQTYGGVQIHNLDSRQSIKSIRHLVKSVFHGNIFAKGLINDGGAGEFGVNYIPTEFKRLSLNERVELARMLSWENLKSWDFNAFEVEKISSQNDINQGCPVVLIGWAVLASPHAQMAMAKNVNDAELIEQAEKSLRKKSDSHFHPIAKTICENVTDDNDTAEVCDEEDLDGYYFMDIFGITPRAICQFLRKVEIEYPLRNANPYHNNIHASDVIQTTHALIQMGGPDLSNVYSCLDMFTILAAAALHDIGHPGTNNNYQVNKQTDLALVYNDQSVLENMHASRASHLLKESEEDPESDDILGTMGRKDRVKVRHGIIQSILSTDMSHHFKSVAKMEEYIDEVIDEIKLETSELPESNPTSLLTRLQSNKHSKLKEKLLPFILHLADISNPAKSTDVTVEWAHSAYDEFFLQGDKEAMEGMPISPLCDRHATNAHDGQVGFITYVVKPAFLVLQKCLPGVEVVLSQLDQNLKYWETKKEHEQA